MTARVEWEAELDRSLAAARVVADIRRAVGARVAARQARVRRRRRSRVVRGLGVWAAAALAWVLTGIARLWGRR
jgi:hypothetical protein